jgi:hypothetical protein
MIAHLDMARSLVAGAPRSRAQVAVLCNVARYEMLTHRLEAAVELGREALRMAEELGFDELRAHALNTIGASRGDAGDPEGFADLEQSMALASRAASIPDLLRGHNNLIALCDLYGDLERARAAERTTIQLAEHYGQRGFVRFVEAGAAVAHRYFAGEWDDALRRAEAALAADAQGARYYQTAAMHAFRGLIRVARGDVEGAETDAEHAVEIAREVRDPQALYPDLAMAAAIFVSVDNVRRAEQTVTEAVEGLDELRVLGFAALELPYLAWATLTAGRHADLASMIDRESFKSPWLRAAQSVVSRDFPAAADILAGIGVVAHEAFFRLKAAEQLVAEGRRAEADNQLRQALAFYRSVEASRYVREGEALLAASA